VPFVGVALAELGIQGDPEVSVDTQLAPEQQVPQAYVALASQRGATLEAYAIFELPPPEAPEPPTPPAPIQVPVHVPVVDHEALHAVQAELAREKLRAEALASQVDTLRPQVARAIELEREVMSRGRALAELSNEVEEVRAAAEAGAAAAAQIEELARRADRAERALTRFEPELARLTDAHAAELQRFEAALRDRAAAIRALEVEVTRRDRMVQELVAALDEHTAAPQPPQSHAGPSDEALDENTRLCARLDAMALDLARREGEAQASAWKIEELERRLAAAPGSRAAAPVPAASAADRSRELAAALDEIDALRRALTQEHEQRVRAESAAALARPSSVGAEPSAH